MLGVKALNLLIINGLSDASRPAVIPMPVTQPLRIHALNTLRPRAARGRWKEVPAAAVTIRTTQERAAVAVANDAQGDSVFFTKHVSDV